MEISQTTTVERIARVLAGRRLSANADGAEPSASQSVEATWSTFVPDAIAVLKSIREPDATMVAAGDALTWSAMVAAALGDPPRSQDGAGKLSTDESPSTAYGAPQAVAEEIFGSSAATSQTDSRPPTLVAVMTDEEEGLRLTLRYADDDRRLLSGGSSRTCLVADLAEADREIETILQAHPGSEVVRTGDGWTTHPE